MSIEHYPWGKTLSYSCARFIMVISSRGFGKTYGARKTAIKSFLKDGSRFVEVVRYKNELGDVQNAYFDKLQLNNEFPGYIFKTQGNAGYIAKAPKEDEKPKWQHMCYFVALSGQQKAKKRTFVNVRYVIFDEFLIDSSNRWASYLPNEFGEFLNLFDSIAREVPGEGCKVTCLLLGNSCNLVNPYFAAFGINEEPSYGYHFYKKKEVLLHYVEPGDYGAAKLDTVVGRLANGSAAGAVMIENKFSDANNAFIASKPKSAKFDFGFIYRGQQIGLWLDPVESLYYVNGKIPNNTERPIFSLTTPDNSPNYIILRKADKRLRGFLELYYLGIVRYENPAIRAAFMKALTVFGIK